MCCRAVLVTGGKAVPMTVDHKPTEPQEEARIRSAGGFVIRGRVNACLNVSRALGDAQFKTVSAARTGRSSATVPVSARCTRMRDEVALLMSCNAQDLSRSLKEQQVSCAPDVRDATVTSTSDFLVRET